jgi:hypothetical protein
MPNYLFQHGPGSVRNLDTDKRLKRNRPPAPMVERDSLHGAQGRVKNPDMDRRLKKNRVKQDPEIGSGNL